MVWPRLIPGLFTRVTHGLIRTAHAVRVYQAHGEVVPVPLVHAVTAPAAVRLVLPHLPTELHASTVAALWQANVAMLVALTVDQRGENTTLTTAIESDPPPFDELVARAVEHGDDHVIKFTEACAREHALRPDPRFPAAVHAAQQRIPRLNLHT